MILAEAVQIVKTEDTGGFRPRATRGRDASGYPMAFFGSAN